MIDTWLVRMARWVRRPPSERLVRLFLLVIAACAVLYGIEQIWGWPDWLTTDRVRPGRIR